MLNNYNMRISYFNEGKQYASSKDKTGHYVIDTDCSDNAIKCVLKPSVKMDTIKFTLTYEYTFGENSFVFPNGYQSWTDSREMNRHDVMLPLTKICAAIDPLLHSTAYGDYKFTTYTKDKGVFHGFSYGYVRNNDEYELIGSLRESNGFTVLYYDMRSNKIIVQKDLDGIELEAADEYEIMNLFYAKGAYDEVFDSYFAALDIKPCAKTPITGYTSWYRHSADISETAILEDLDALSKLDKKLDIFQIDDGFQSNIGDWLMLDESKFPNGIKLIADKAHESGMKAGLWLAPFAATRKSKMYLEHQDWFIKDAKHNIPTVGMNWGGFMALDIYNLEVREYLKQVFDTVLKEWGFDMVKLDFLYCICCTPYNGKTRGEIMSDGIDFLRECVGDKLILGCGVPLFPAFGKLDYCRIGCDVTMSWKPFNYFTRMHRENISVENTLRSTIFRRHLNGRAFVSDPDVIILRQAENVHLTPEQQRVMALINKIGGSILFISDNVADYTAEQKEAFDKYVNKNEATIIDAKFVAPEVVSIRYTLDGVEDEITLNMRHGTNIQHGAPTVNADTANN